MKKIILSFLIVLVITFGVLWLVGWNLSKPVNLSVGNCPNDLSCENVELKSKSNSLIKGWLVKGESGKGIVVLMHGVRGNRSDMVGRIKFLNEKGFSVLAFDFQSHGESIGNQITFGFQERLDSDAALEFAKNKFPNEKIGVVGISMGGAAFLLSDKKDLANAVVLEMVYPTMEKAVENRLNLWLFEGADFIEPILTWQFKPRLGVSIDSLRPIDEIEKVKIPKFFVVGEKDVHTTMEESEEFFKKANEPKEMWIVPKAEHTDLLKIEPIKYKEKVIDFFEKNLQ